MRQGTRGLVGAAVAGVLAAAAATAARAGETGGGEAARLEPVVVTATRMEQPVEQVGSAVTVIDGEELRRRRIEFVAEALEEVPGVTVPRSGTAGKTASLFLRGTNANQTLVLIDGVRVNDPVGGAFDFSGLTTDNIERIEVIRGPQSPLYGSEAMGGVVNIITRRARGPLTGTVEAAAGTHHASRAAAAVRGASERLDASVEVSRYATDNRFENDDFEVKTASGRLDGRLTDRLSATVTFRHSDAETGAPFQVFIAADPDDRQEDVLTAASATLEHRTASAWTQRLTVGRVDRELTFREDPALAADVTRSVLRSAEWVHTVAVGPLSLVLGGEFRTEDGEFRTEDGEGFTVDETLTTRALFAQAQAFLLGERLTLLAGARLDDGTQLDSEVTPKVSGAFLLPDSSTRLHASWGKGIKAPTLLDLFFPGFANPGLGPERVTGWDAGVEQRLGRSVTADVTFFRNDFTDLIVFSPVTFLPENVGHAHSYGVESSLEIRPAERVDLGGTYTYLVATNDEAGNQLLRRPRNQGSARLTLHRGRGGSLTLSGLYVGARRDNTFAILGAPDVKLGGYLRLDASAVLPLPRPAGLRALDLVARAENLLDRDYEEVAGFPALGFALLVGLRGTF